MHPCHTKGYECQHLQSLDIYSSHHLSPNLCSFSSNQDSSCLSKQLPKRAYSSGNTYPSLLGAFTMSGSNSLGELTHPLKGGRTNISYKQHYLTIFLGQQSSNFLSQDTFTLLRNMEDPKELFYGLCSIEMTVLEIKMEESLQHINTEAYILLTSRVMTSSHFMQPLKVFTIYS